MKRILFFLIIALAFALRFYQLGTNPPSLDWDEVSTGYNAYSILKTGADEYGNSWPFSIRSFNDYKPPLLTYLTIPSIAIFGLTEFSVRLPAVILGVIAVAGLYGLIFELFPAHKKRSELALVGAFLLAISPWHLQFSRASFEAGSALCFYILAVWTFLRWVNLSKNSKGTKKTSNNQVKSRGSQIIQPPRLNTLVTSGILWLLLSALFAATTLYAYHSARLVVPLMFLGLGIRYFKPIWQKKFQLIPAIVLGLIILFPLLVITFRGSTAQRFNSVSIFTNPGEFSRERELMDRMKEFKAESSWPFTYFYSQKATYARIIARNYFEHFNFDFLFLRGDGNNRHHTPGMGLLYLIEIPALLYGIYALTDSKEKHKSVVFLWLLVAPVASALTADTPHAIRGLLMLPTFQIFTAYGLIELKERYPLKLYAISYLLYATLFLINLFYYLNLYYAIYPTKASHDWQFGYKELVQKLEPLESAYDQIIVTNKYDQPHIYFAFYKQIDPREYQTFAETASQGFGPYIFKTIKTDEDFSKPNTLVAADPDNSPNQEPLDSINFINGETAFNLFETASN